MTDVERVFIDVAAGVRLEAFVHRPLHAAAAPRAALDGALIVHPHPKLGGDAHNPVVLALARRLCDEAGVMCVRLQLRGCGASQGRSSWRGGDDALDVHAALRHLVLERADVRRVCVVGYSFGASLAYSALASWLRDVEVSAADRQRVQKLVLLSPAWGWLASVLLGRHLRTPLLDDRRGTDDGAAASPSPPPPPHTLVVIGDGDEFSSLRATRAAFAALSPPKTLQVVPGGDHFWQTGAPELLATAIDHVVAFVLDSNHGH